MDASLTCCRQLAPIYHQTQVEEAVKMLMHVGGKPLESKGNFEPTILTHITRQPGVL